jgi:hypothetical protein
VCIQEKFKMNFKAAQKRNVQKFRQWLRLVSILAFCMIVACFFIVASSIGQSIVSQSSTTEPQSVISLAPSPKPDAENLALRAGNSRFENAPANYHVFTASTVGENKGAEILTLNFAGETTLTGIKSTNRDFVIDPGGTCQEGNSYNRGESCSLLVRFNPQGPGHRLGFLSIAHSAGATPANFGLTGNGYVPAISFTPSQITTVPATVSSGNGTISGATSLAIDGGDILYVADIGNNIIKEIDSTGVINTIAPAFATPASIAVDSLGIIYSANVSGSTYYFSYFAPWATQTAYGTTYAPGACTPSAPCPLTTVGMSRPAHMSIDAYDNLFFEEGTKGAAEMPVANVSGGTGSFNLWYLSDQFAYSSGTPGSFAVDASGNLYTSYIYTVAGTCFLLEEPLYNAEYSPTAVRVAGGVKCGFSGDGGQGRGAEISSTIGQIAFDVAGNLYFADAGNQRVRRVDAGTGIIRTVAGNGTAGYTGDNGAATSAKLDAPAGLAVDSQGQVYILSNSATTGTAQVVRKVGTTGWLAFPSTAQGSSSATMVVNIANTGNTALTFVRDTISGSNAGDFSIDPSATNCNFAAGNYLDPAYTCQIGVIFKPAAGGSRAATLTLVDNTVNGVNKVHLSGTATTPANIRFSAPTAQLLSAKEAVTVSVEVTATGGPEPTGKVNFSVDGKFVVSATLASEAATANLGTLAVGKHQVTASYLGDEYHPLVRSAKTVTVTQ